MRGAEGTILSVEGREDNIGIGERIREGGGVRAGSWEEEGIATIDSSTIGGSSSY